MIEVDHGGVYIRGSADSRGIAEALCNAFHRLGDVALRCRVAGRRSDLTQLRGRQDGAGPNPKVLGSEAIPHSRANILVDIRRADGPGASLFTHVLKQPRTRQGLNLQDYLR